MNGTAYQPSLSSNNKKQAKTLCAKVALQTMGMLPKDPPATTTAPPAPPMAPPEPPPPHVQQPNFQQMHTLQTVPDFDLSSFR